MNKLHYYQLSLEEIAKIKALPYKPKLLLHACCAPCSCFPLTFLHEHFQITIYYNNSNIYPQTEYQIRLEELKKYLHDYYPDIAIIVPTYDHDNYIKDLAPFAHLPEGQQRCFLCYTKRMDEAYAYASQHGFAYFTTVMSVSRQKNSLKLNEIGEALSKKYPNVKYFYSDFKKKDGFLIGNNMAKALNMYRQKYCGCEYSMPKEENDHE
ncbi:MAG: epoxyqueuosine reductase QueH [Erysipelotrichaceae bacterium]|nr:epoxyqueuosine reductase QueH [Erysipelotrichaceae bacterium]MDY5252053.1 epoxyqueuosine reductase QueH [Erysipelotrichaceae bacterium]